MKHRADGSSVRAAGGQSRRNTWLVLCLALAGRLLTVWFVVARMPAGWLYTRGVEMGFLASSVLSGTGLSSPFGMPTGPTAMIAPAYPIFVAGVFGVFGRYSVASSLVIMGAQTALNLLTIWMVMRLARRFANEGGAVLIGGFCACSLPLLWMPTIFWETNLSATLLVGAVTLVLEIAISSTWAKWIGCSLLCGCCGLVNPALLPSVVMMAGWAAYRVGRQSRLKVMLAAALFPLVLSPWPIRNARVFHTLVVTRTTAGLELWMGNRAGATGYLDESVFPMFNAAELARYKAVGEIRYTNEKTTLARRYIVVHPLRFVGLTLMRVGRFWTGTGNNTGSLFYLLHALLTTFFGAAGVRWLFRSEWQSVAPAFLIPIVLFPMPYYLTHAEFRYRLVLDPVLCVMAAYTLAHVGQKGGKARKALEARDSVQRATAA